MRCTKHFRRAARVDRARPRQAAGRVAISGCRSIGPVARMVVRASPNPSGISNYIGESAAPNVNPAKLSRGGKSRVAPKSFPPTILCCVPFGLGYVGLNLVGCDGPTRGLHGPWRREARDVVLDGRWRRESPTSGNRASRRSCPREGPRDLTFSQGPGTSSTKAFIYIRPPVVFGYAARPR